MHATRCTIIVGHCDFVYHRAGANFRICWISCGPFGHRDGAHCLWPPSLCFSGSFFGPIWGCLVVISCFCSGLWRFLASLLAVLALIFVFFGVSCGSFWHRDGGHCLWPPSLRFSRSFSNPFWGRLAVVWFIVAGKWGFPPNKNISQRWGPNIVAPISWNARKLFGVGRTASVGRSKVVGRLRDYSL